jgi:uncharacterized protein YndB with AHSA1/START domain
LARQELGNDTTTVVADGAELIVERVLDAPAELVWTAMTTPEHVAQWWGRKGTTTKVVELDVRPGGRWRFIAEAGEGMEAPFTGEFQQVEAPKKIVRTTFFDVPPFNTAPPAVDTTTLEETGGKTRVRVDSRFPAAEILQGALAEGMVDGTIEQYDRLADLLTKIA